MSSHDTKVFDAVADSAGHKTKSSHRLQRMFSLLLFTVFVVVDLLALVAGASSFGSLTAMQNTNDARIMTLGPITSSVRANDASGSVSTGEGPEGRALVLTQSDSEGSYETRIYLHEGKIVQEYTLAEEPYAPEKATPLADSSTFEFSYGNGLLTVRTDAGEAIIALRNQQGGE
jgi:hypothetical protein